MKNVDGVNTAFPDQMTANQWSAYVVGHDPDDLTRGAEPVGSRDFDLSNVRVFAGRFRAGRDLTEEQAAAVDNLRDLLGSQDRRLIDAVFGGAA